MIQNARNTCKFCQILRKELPSYPVFEDDIAFAFLDLVPLFAGHVLVVPKFHVETLHDLPADAVGQFFQSVQMVSQAIPNAMKAQGSFVAINNRVSQSIPHLHVHIVPRNKGDGLKGFFWPRQRGIPDAIFREVQEKIIREISRG